MGLVLILLGCTSTVKEARDGVTVVGQMSSVMRKGQLAGSIDLDTMTNKVSLYGLGPVEYLRGELLIMDGKSYKSVVTSDTTMRVDETYAVKAPFFAFANISKWAEHRVPDSIQTVFELERYVGILARDSPIPFLFRLSGTVAKATIHIVNLPVGGTPVGLPEESHKGRRNYNLYNEPVEIIGFFSKKHKGIFTHHDTFLHMHLITTDFKKMGHLDAVQFTAGAMKLYLPASR